MPLVSFTNLPSSPPKHLDLPVDSDSSPRKWYHHLMLLGTALLIFAPHPSLLYFLLIHYLKTLDSPIRFAFHLFVCYTLTFGAYTSLIVCVARDPGPTTSISENENENEGEDEMGLTEALLSGHHDDDFNSPAKWCRKCWAPKYERTHHCSMCGRCVLKMDHHCPWLGSRCIGHRTYPAFLHFLFCITLLSIYIASICASGVYWAFQHPWEADETMPLHAIALFFAGCLFTLVIGSFTVYHVYLVSTNQTTIEHISPFLLLRYLPSHSQTRPIPEEHELSFPQRRLVKDAHGEIRMYDVGFRQNWAQVFGIGTRGNNSWKWWLVRILCGGSSPGDGKTFPRSPRSEEMLARLAT
ncbi:palmitoyltransferase pfa3 [Moniliophthora roreri]|nr:palmitoyltransferase pfa3 [Moniliophthora roreri]